MYQTEIKFSITPVTYCKLIRAEKGYRRLIFCECNVSTPFGFGFCGFYMSYDIDMLKECNDHCANYGFEIICFLRRFLSIQDTFKTEVMKETGKDAA